MNNRDCCDNYCGKYTSSVQKKSTWHLYSYFFSTYPTVGYMYVYVLKFVIKTTNAAALIRDFWRNVHIAAVWDPNLNPSRSQQ